MKDKIEINCIGIGDDRYEYLTQFLRDCEYEYKEIDKRDEMLDSLGFYAINDSKELPAILDKLLAAKDTDADLDEIVPELELWQNVENWSYNDLMGAIS